MEKGLSEKGEQRVVRRELVIISYPKILNERQARRLTAHYYQDTTPRSSVNYNAVKDTKKNHKTSKT